MKQTLIKITDDHYVVVDKTIQPVNGYYYDDFIKEIRNTSGAEYGEASHCWQITHSTQPNKGMENVTFISPREVKEHFCWLDETEWEVEIVDGKLKLI
jgi:hypothetical protein